MNIRLLLTLITVQLALLMSPYATAVSPDFSQARIERDAKNHNYWIKQDGCRGFVGIRVAPAEEFDNAKVTLESDTLVVDTRKMFDASPAGRGVCVYFHGLDLSNACKLPEGQIATERTNRISVELKSSEPSSASLLYEGNTQDGKHYWRAKNVVLTGNWQTIYFDNVLPENIKSCAIRLDLKKPVEVQIRKADFAVVELEKEDEVKLDSTKNHIINGGAEMGWNHIQYYPLANMRNAETGKVVFWNKVVPTDELRLLLDSEEKYSGKFSFRMEVPKGKTLNRGVNFNHVPYIPGKPCSLSFYAKADHTTSANCGFFLANGIALIRNFSIGTEWKRYEFYVPSWGEKANDANIIGDIVNGYAKGTRLAQPYVMSNEAGTVWLDNVAYSLGGHADYREENAVAISHVLDKAASYYYTGDVPNVTLTLNNLSNRDQNGQLSYRILDVFGNEVAIKSLETVELPANGTLTHVVSLELPASLRGPLNAVFKYTVGKQEYTSVAYLGVIDKPGPLNFRFGLECPSDMNISMCIPYLKDFRVGSARVGTASGSTGNALRNAKFLKAAGFDVLLNISLPIKAVNDEALWQSDLARIDAELAKHGQYADIIESQNEPNISSGWTIDTNVRQMQDLYGLIQKHNLNVKYAGPVANCTDFTWVSNILHSPAGELLDIVTDHPYRQLPELPDYADDVASMRKVIDLVNPNLEYYATEAGITNPSSLQTGYIDTYCRNAAARDVRVILYGLSAGLGRYYRFAISVIPQGTAWASTFAGSPGNNGVVVPNIALYAMRSAIDRIGDARLAGRVKLGADYRCVIFDHGSHRTAVLWKWQGEPTRLHFANGDADKVTAYDFVGTRLNLASAPEVGECPVYMDSNLSADELSALLTRASFSGENAITMELDTTVRSENSFAVQIKNRTGKALQNVKVTVTPTDVIIGEAETTVAQIAPEATASIEFKLVKKISTASQKLTVKAQCESDKAPVVHEANLQAVVVSRTANALKIDGDLSDWPANTTVATLDWNNTDRTASQFIASGWTDAYRKIRADLQYAWDDNFLYTAVTVYKPDFFTIPNDKDAGSAWNFDSLQINYDTLSNAPKGLTGLGDDDFEYTLALTSEKQPIVYRRWASAAMYDSLPKNSGLVVPQEVQLAVRTYDDRIVYEIAFARRAVSPFRLLPYSTMRTSLVVNVNDGKQRIGWLELTPGLAQSPKRPDQWMDLVLLP